MVGPSIEASSDSAAGCVRELYSSGVGAVSGVRRLRLARAMQELPRLSPGATVPMESSGRVGDCDVD